jgi:hypothetical protein
MPHCPRGLDGCFAPALASLRRRQRYVAHRRTRRNARGALRWIAAMSTPVRKGAIRRPPASRTGSGGGNLDAFSGHVARRRTRRNARRGATEGGDERVGWEERVIRPSSTLANRIDQWRPLNGTEGRTPKPLYSRPPRRPTIHTETPAPNDATRDAHARR